ncbi:MAG TPA: DUF4262 domain-containing protein [Acidimicrobiia bacterium]|nr:DUF4262 domain-containing protein [Acidimicrobiia bacterium]
MDRFSAVDAFWFRIEAALARGGCFVVHVSGSPTTPSWAYTIGFLEHFGKPELVTTGLSPESSSAFLQWAFDAAKEGEPLLVGREHRRVCWHELPISVVEVPPDRYLPPSDLGNMLFAYYAARGGRFPAEPRMHQLVWPDFDGRLPWDAGFDEHWRPYQPLLDEVPWAPDHSHDEPCWGCDLAEDEHPQGFQ